MNLTSLLNQSSKQPKLILRIVISVSIGLLVIWIFLVSKMDVPSQRDSILVKADTSESITDLRSNLLGEIQSPKQSTQEGTVVTKEEPLFENALTTFFIMIVVLGSIWLWTLKKKKHTIKQDQDIKDISQHVIGQGVQIKILEINEEMWILGVTSNSINLLHRYKKNEWHLSKIPDPDSEEISESDFNSIFKLLGN